MLDSLLVHPQLSAYILGYISKEDVFSTLLTNKHYFDLLTPNISLIAPFFFLINHFTPIFIFDINKIYKNYNFIGNQYKYHRPLYLIEYPILPYVAQGNKISSLLKLNSQPTYPSIPPSVSHVYFSSHFNLDLPSFPPSITHLFFGDSFSKVRRNK